MQEYLHSASKWVNQKDRESLRSMWISYAYETFKRKEDHGFSALIHNVLQIKKEWKNTRRRKKEVESKEKFKIWPSYKLWKDSKNLSKEG